MLATLELHFNETPSRDWVARVLQQGVWDLLCDLEETGWLEAKREHYRKDPRDELNFASDVAALCNAEGGVLIIGAKTKRQPDGDRITAINQCPLHPETVRRYTQLLGRLVFPAPIGVQIVALHDPARKASGLLVVNVPPQPRESRPFLVGGALIGDSVHRAMVGIPIRRGADTDWMHIAGLHARLRLGRSALGD
jgi:hypothetical protein